MKVNTKILAAVSALSAIAIVALLYLLSSNTVALETQGLVGLSAQEPQTNTTIGRILQSSGLAETENVTAKMEGATDAIQYNTREETAKTYPPKLSYFEQKKAEQLETRCIGCNAGFVDVSPQAMQGIQAKIALKKDGRETAKSDK
ncbi:MAG: hypothetical protein NUV67_05245, partial [archaeon]|nr:hypothetical protein [archaeon]